MRTELSSTQSSRVQISSTYGVGLRAPRIGPTFVPSFLPVGAARAVGPAISSFVTSLVRPQATAHPVKAVGSTTGIAPSSHAVSSRCSRHGPCLPSLTRPIQRAVETACSGASVASARNLRPSRSRVGTISGVMRGEVTRAASEGGPWCGAVVCVSRARIFRPLSLSASTYEEDGVSVDGPHAKRGKCVSRGGSSAVSRAR